ncbi:MAG: tripartite tricarboxylate transporter substrate binding protein [Burkholderiales bacterium]|nr:tripartite tricarboxylate transporter substrate binding protein [Burkholderiales bacterium]
MTYRSTIKVLLLLVIQGGAALAQAQAQAYPTKPVRLIVPFLAGGPSDGLARIVSQELSQALGQQVIVQNRPGADGVIAAQAVLNSPPDGHTLFWAGNSTLVGVPLTHKNPVFDPIKSFAPVSLVGRFTLGLFVHTDLPVTSLAELVGHARANPGKLNYATSSLGDVVAFAQLLKASGIVMERVRYKGAAQAIPDIVAGRVQALIVPIQSAMPHVRTGRLRMLAILLPRRSPAALEIPTITEAGMPEVTVTLWAGVFGPARMHHDIVKRLSLDLNQVLKRPSVQVQFEQQAFQGEGSTPDALTVLLKEGLGDWGPVVHELDIKQE